MTKIIKKDGSCNAPTYVQHDGKCMIPGDTLTAFTSPKLSVNFAISDNGTNDTKEKCEAKCTAAAKTCRAYYYNLTKDPKECYTITTTLSDTPAITYDSEANYFCHISDSRGIAPA